MSVVVNADPCGQGPLRLTASSGRIKSPGYDQNRYQNNAACQWLIEAPTGTVSHAYVIEKNLTKWHPVSNRPLVLRQNGIISSVCDVGFEVRTNEDRVFKERGLDPDDFQFSSSLVSISLRLWQCTCGTLQWPWNNDPGPSVEIKYSYRVSQDQKPVWDWSWHKSAPSDPKIA